VARLFASHLNDPAGHSNSLLQWQGKTLVVNFWATWCPPCREEMPAFSRLQERYAAQGVQFVGIALDSVENVRTRMHALSPVSYPLLIGGPEAWRSGPGSGEQEPEPSLYRVIIPQGEVRLMQMGALAESDLERIAGQQTA
jgi:thiol-disulfide isomerase/thioredoxin